MKHLAYLPIDIDVEWPDEELILKWFEDHKLLDDDYCINNAPNNMLYPRLLA